MKVLLDTHVFLWFIDGDRRLSKRAGEIMSDPAADLFLSVASVWEIVVKAGTGNLKLAIEPERFVREQLKINAIRTLDITSDHALAVGRLPRHHRDPFDRMLIAQATVERLPIITADADIVKYSVSVIW